MITTTITNVHEGDVRAGSKKPRRSLWYKIKLQFWLRELKRYAKTVRKIDDLFKQYDIPRCERRRFWRDFVADKITRETVNNWAEKGAQ